VDWDLTIRPQADKGTLLMCRILWFFSTAAAQLHRADLLDNAQHAYRFLADRCWDESAEGMIWSVGHDGSWSDTTKHAYGQAFAIYSLSAYWRASRDREALELANRLFDVLESRFSAGIGYQEALDRQFNPISNDKLSENGVLADQTMNTLLHILEAYSGLYEAGGASPLVGRAIRRVLDIFAVHVYNHQARRLEVFFDSNMRPLLDMQSFGHDLEAAWLIDWGVGLMADPALTRRFDLITDDLVASVFERAYRDGAVAFESVGGKLDDRRVWWVQVEAMVSFMRASAKPSCSRPEEYRRVAGSVWDYLESHFFDPRPGGEWYWEVGRSGEPAPGLPIVSTWKCPYHSGRACLMIMADLEPSGSDADLVEVSHAAS
jgi:mannose/cellobiose epimerase-like protein (N-acyl-D-glucosamine 2-epimerase family)